MESSTGKNKMSNFVSYALTVADLVALESQGIKQVIIPFDLLTPHLALSESAFEMLMSKAEERGFLLFVDLDIIPLEDEFDLCLKAVSWIFLKWPATIFRVKNYGMVEALVELYPNISLHLNVEAGHHNEEALLKLATIYKKNIRRFILSIELPQLDIIQMVKAIPSEIEIELLLLGPIFLFYSPRKLLSSTEKEANSELFALADSEESAHKNFRIYQNRHGTIIYHHKYLSLLREMDKLQAEKISAFRLDFREIAKREELFNLFSKDIDIDIPQFKKIFPFPVMAGFHQINKSDSIFIKLKNQNLRRRDQKDRPGELGEKRQEYLGTVLDAKKGAYLAIVNLNRELCLSRGAHLAITTPLGKVIHTKISSLSNSAGTEISSLSYEQIGFINYVKGVTTKSLVLLCD